MRKLYKELMMLKEIQSISSDKNTIDNYIISLKKRIRNLSKQDTDCSDIVWTSDYTGYARVDFEGIFTEEEKAEYIKDNWIYINSPYDCTGKLFTTYIGVFNMTAVNRSVAYFRFSIDC